MTEEEIKDGYQDLWDTNSYRMQQMCDKHNVDKNELLMMMILRPKEMMNEFIGLLNG